MSSYKFLVIAYILRSTLQARNLFQEKDQRPVYNQEIKKFILIVSELESTLSSLHSPFQLKSFILISVEQEELLNSFASLGILKKNSVVDLQILQCEEFSSKLPIKHLKTEISFTENSSDKKITEEIYMKILEQFLNQHFNPEFSGNLASNIWEVSNSTVYTMGKGISARKAISCGKRNNQVNLEFGLTFEELPESEGEKFETHSQYLKPSGIKDDRNSDSLGTDRNDGPSFLKVAFFVVLILFLLYCVTGSCYNYIVVNRRTFYGVIPNGDIWIKLLKWDRSARVGEDITTIYEDEEVQEEGMGYFGVNV